MDLSEFPQQRYTVLYHYCKEPHDGFLGNCAARGENGTTYNIALVTSSVKDGVAVFDALNVRFDTASFSH